MAHCNVHSNSEMYKSLKFLIKVKSFPGLMVPQGGAGKPETS